MPRVLVYTQHRRQQESADKSTGDVLGHVDMNHAIGSFCSLDLTNLINKVAQAAIMEAVKSRFSLRVHVSVQGAQRDNHTRHPHKPSMLGFGGLA